MTNTFKNNETKNYSVTKLDLLNNIRTTTNNKNNTNNLHSETEISSTYFILSTHCCTLIFPITLNIIIIITDFVYNHRCD